MRPGMQPPRLPSGRGGTPSHDRKDDMRSAGGGAGEVASPGHAGRCTVSLMDRQVAQAVSRGSNRRGKPGCGVDRLAYAPLCRVSLATGWRAPAELLTAVQLVRASCFAVLTSQSSGMLCPRGCGHVTGKSTGRRRGAGERGDDGGRGPGRAVLGRGRRGTEVSAWRPMARQ